MHTVYSYDHIGRDRGMIRLSESNLSDIGPLSMTKVRRRKTTLPVQVNSDTTVSIIHT
jgi:hypothetical protein